MALSTKFTSFNTGTGAAGSTVDVTLGFQPKAFIVWWSGRTETVDTVGRADSHIGIGLGVSSTQRVCACWSRDDANAAETGAMVMESDQIIARLTVAGVDNGKMDVDATANWPSNGIRFIVDTQFGASMRIHILAWGGDDITNTFVGRTTPSTTVCNNVDQTAPGFLGDIVFFVASNYSSFDSIQTTRASMNFGAAISATKQAINLCMFDPGSGTGDGGQYCFDGSECMGSIDTANPTIVGQRYDFVQMLANGYRIHNTEGTSTRPHGYLVIKGGQWDMGNVLTKTDTTTDITGAPALNGQTPTAIVFSSACRAESVVDAGTTPTRWSLGGATSATEEGAMAEHGEQGSGNTRVGTAVEHDSCYINLADVAADPDAQTIQGLMHVTATGANSFTCRMTDADPAENFVWWVATGPNAAVGGDELLQSRRMMSVP